MLDWCDVVEVAPPYTYFNVPDVGAAVIFTVPLATKCEALPALKVFASDVNDPTPDPMIVLVLYLKLLL